MTGYLGRLEMLHYPTARSAEVVDDYHGTKVSDPYRWLEEADAAETREWIVAQNALTDSWLAEVGNREAIRTRLAELTDHPRAGAPWHRGGRWFVLRNTGLQDQDVLWTMDAADAQGSVLLDPNTLSDDGTVALTGVAVSDDGTLLAYATSASGSDWMTWRVRDVERGEDLPDVVEWSKFSTAAWAPDNSGFWYAGYDAPAAEHAYEQVNRDQRLHFHRLGDDADDAVVYERPDEPEWGFDPHVTHDGRYLILHVWHGTQPTNRAYYLDLQRPDQGVVKLLDAADAAYDFVGSDGSVLLFRTDLDAPRSRVIAVDIEQPERAHWREVIAEGDDALERMHYIGGRLLGVYLHHAHHRLQWFDRDGRPLDEIGLPTVGAVDEITGRQDDRSWCFSFQTFTEPLRTFCYDLDTATTTPLHDAGLDLAELVTEQLFVEHDGVRTPVFLVHRPDVTPDGARPVWLYGYGGFNVPITPICKKEWLVWAELGGVLAVATLRGGGEYGQGWHDDGRLANKQHVFDDAIAVGEWLSRGDAGNGRSWTRPDRLAIHGRSNGGLLAGACLTQRPDLWGAAVPEVGVLDMLRFHRFTIGWGWASDYGTADDAEQFAWLHAYSPLHNLRPGTTYPATLITTGDHDDRVVPGHSFKFAAAMQAAQGGEAPVLLRVELSAGHGVGKPTSLLVAERADVVAFLVRALGVEAGPVPGNYN